MDNRIEQEDGASAASSVFATPPEDMLTDDELEPEDMEIHINPNTNKPEHTHYDIYTLNIQYFQVAIGKPGHDWESILNRGSSEYHLLNSVNFSLQIKRQLILSYDDEAWLDMAIAIFTKI